MYTCVPMCIKHMLGKSKHKKPLALLVNGMAAKTRR